MRICPWLLAVLSGVAANRRKPWIIAACALALSSLGVSEPARAQCASTPPSDFTCPSGSYPNGISVAQPGGATTPLNVTLQSGVNVTGPASNLSGNAVDIVNDVSGTKTFVVMEKGATINVAGSLTGLHVQQGFPGTINTPSDATVTAAGTINVQSNGLRQDAIGVFTTANGASATVNYTGPSGGVVGGTIDLTSSGAGNGTIIQANTQNANGNATVDATGNMLGFLNPGQRFFQGLSATVNGNGNATVLYEKGTITVEGRNAAGIFAGNGDAPGGGAGLVTVTTLPGTTIIDKGTNPGETIPTLGMTPGITAESGGLAAMGTAITENVASTIEMFGPATPAAPFPQPNSILNYPVALRSIARVDAPITVNYTGPGITTSGGGGIGILAYSNGPATSSAFGGSGSVTVNSSGPITTTGTGALGIVADSGKLRNATNGLPAQPGGAVMVTASGAISTKGDVSHGIWASSTTGPVHVTATNVSTTGQFSVGINAVSPGINGTGGGNVVVSIPSGGSVMGGWQADPTAVGSDPTGNFGGLPSAGVVLSSAGGTATLINRGSIGALSDLAVSGDPQIVNAGTITGFVQLVGGDNSILNNGTFDLRDFADTNGDGVRDTVRVVTADFGSGPNNSFTNNGTLALAALPTTPTPKIDSTGEYLPLDNPNNTMALGGPLQGQIIGVSTFTNSGTINLQANPVAGDVLMITGGRGGSTPGTGGGGTYISNGGTLALDTVLNEGGAATHSDTLVVDGTSVGAKGATNIDILNAGGEGAFTGLSDGILVVQVLDPAHSAPGAFTLPNDIVEAGPFDYRLFQGGLQGDNPGDWFLRSVFVVPPINPEPPEPTEPPGKPEPPEPEQPVPPETALPPEIPSLPPPTDEQLPPGVYPIIGPRLATDGVVQPIARQMGLTTLGTLHQRIGETLLQESPDGWTPSAWGRVFGDQIDNSYQAFADPNVDGRIIGVQVGLDIWRGNLIKDKGHRDAAGLYFAYGHSAADVNGLVTNPVATGYVMTQTGSLDLNGYSGGAYWTHYGPSGWYLDGVVQGTAYTGTATTAVSSLPTTGSGILVSLEGGYPVPLPLGPNFILEPQAQIIWQHVGFSEANDGLTSVDLGSTSGTTGRLGLRGQWTIPSDNGLVWQPYVRANIWRDWGGNASTTFSGSPVAVPLLEQATRLEFAGGITARVNSTLSFYAQGGYQFAVGDTAGGERQGVSGDLGLRVTW